MLQGSLDNFGLDEVLGLLANTGKTGRMRITGDRGSGSLWLASGELIGSDASSAADGGPIDETVFELLRFVTGNFSFNVDEAPAELSEPRSVTEVLAAASERLAQWREIEAVVPSLAHVVAPVAVLPVPEVTITSDEWDLLMVIGAGVPVRSVCDHFGLGEVEGSRRVKLLIERDLAELSAPVDPARILVDRSHDEAADGILVGEAEYLDEPVVANEAPRHEPVTDEASIFEATAADQFADADDVTSGTADSESADAAMGAFEAGRSDTLDGIADSFEPSEAPFEPSEAPSETAEDLDVDGFVADRFGLQDPVPAPDHDGGVEQPKARFGDEGFGANALDTEAPAEPGFLEAKQSSGTSWSPPDVSSGEPTVGAFDVAAPASPDSTPSPSLDELIPMNSVIRDAAFPNETGPEQPGSQDAAPVDADSMDFSFAPPPEPTPEADGRLVDAFDPPVVEPAFDAPSADRRVAFDAPQPGAGEPLQRRSSDMAPPPPPAPPADFAPAAFDAAPPPPAPPSPADLISKAPAERYDESRRATDPVVEPVEAMLENDEDDGSLLMQYLRDET